MQQLGNQLPLTAFESGGVCSFNATSQQGAIKRPIFSIFSKFLGYFGPAYTPIKVCYQQVIMGSGLSFLFDRISSGRKKTLTGTDYWVILC